MENERFITAKLLRASELREEALAGPGYVSVQAVPLLLEAIWNQNAVIIELLRNNHGTD